MARNGGLVVRTPDGAEWGIATLSRAREVFPDGEVVRYQDGTPYEGKQIADTSSEVTEGTTETPEGGTPASNTQESPESTEEAPKARKK